MPWFSHHQAISRQIIDHKNWNVIVFLESESQNLLSFSIKEWLNTTKAQVNMDSQ